MSRYHKLIEKVNTELKADKSGKLEQRLVRLRIMKKVAKDLIATKQLPASWSGVNNEHIFLLINIWRDQKLSESTIANYLSTIRYFFKKANIQQIAPNSEFGINRKYSKNKTHIGVNQYNKLLHPFVKCIFGFELFFGLHRLEAVKLKNFDANINEEQIWISRNYSFNGIERFIPILTNEQQNVITQFVNLTPVGSSMADIIEESSLINLYKAELATININATEQYRKHYVKYRARLLKDSLSNQNTSFIKLISDETGIRSERLIREYLR